MFSAKRAPEDHTLTDEDDESFERIDDLYNITERQESAESDLYDYDDVSVDEMSLLRSELAKAKLEIDRFSKQNESSWMKRNKMPIIIVVSLAVMTMFPLLLLSVHHNKQLVAMEKSLLNKSHQECEQKIIVEMNKYRSCPQMEYHFDNLERKLKEAQEWKASYEKLDNCGPALKGAKLGNELLEKKLDELLKRNDEKKKEEENRAKNIRKRDAEFITFVAGAFIVMIVLIICLKMFSPKGKKSFKKCPTALVAAENCSKTRARQEEDMNTELEMHVEHTEKLRIELDNLKKKQAESQIAGIVEKPDDKVVKPEETTYVTEKEITANVASEINQAVLEMLERMEMLENKLFAITP